MIYKNLRPLPSNRSLLTQSEIALIAKHIINDQPKTNKIVNRYLPIYQTLIQQEVVYLLTLTSLQYKNRNSSPRLIFPKSA